MLTMLYTFGCQSAPSRNAKESTSLRTLSLPLFCPTMEKKMEEDVVYTQTGGYYSIKAEPGDVSHCYCRHCLPNPKLRL